MCEVSEIVDVKKVVSDLKNNPVFRMSLASKELFHSNMLAWFLESNDSEDSLLSGIAKELAKLFMPDYTVLTVLRERKHFDLLVVLFPTKYYDITIKNSLTGIAEFFQNSEPTSEDLLKKLKSCKFAVVENKFKSIPNKDQLDGYKNKAKITFKTKESKIKIEMNNNNTTYYLLAPQVSLNHFEKCGWQEVSWNKISDILSEALKTKEKRDHFTFQFIEYYADFLDNMLELTKDIEEKLNSPNKSAFPDWQDIFKLKKIRIHDFYEKLWFSVLLNKIIEMTGEDKFNRKGSGYTNALGLLDFKIIEDKEKHVWYGIQIQNKQLRIVVEPEWGYKWQGECPKEQIIKYCNDILNFMNQQETCPTFGFSNTKDLCSFKDFKYRYIPLENDISIKDLASKINKALTAIQESTLIKFDSAPTGQQ